MVLWKCCTQYAIKFGKLDNGHRTGKCQFSFQSKKSNAKEYSNYRTITLISHTSKVMLQILQARIQQICEPRASRCSSCFRKGTGMRDQIANIHWIMENAREFQKTSISALLIMPKPLTVWITINCGKFWEMRIPDHLTCILRNM